jgi:hypothetical protein
MLFATACAAGRSSDGEVLANQPMVAPRSTSRGRATVPTVVSETSKPNVTISAPSASTERSDAPVEQPDGEVVAGFSACWKKDEQTRCLVSGKPALRCDGELAINGKRALKCSYRGQALLDSDLPVFGCRLHANQVLLLDDANGGKLLASRAQTVAELRPRTESDKVALVSYLFQFDEEGYGGKKATIVPGKSNRIQGFHKQLCGCSHPISSVVVELGEMAAKELSRTVVGNWREGLCID